MISTTGISTTKAKAAPPTIGLPTSSKPAVVPEDGPIPLVKLTSDVKKRLKEIVGKILIDNPDRIVAAQDAMDKLMENPENYKQLVEVRRLMLNLFVTEPVCDRTCL